MALTKPKKKTNRQQVSLKGALTPKQEKFCQVYLETGNASEAYRQAYDCKSTNLNTIAVQANAILTNPKVAPRIAELKEIHLKRHTATVDRVLQELCRLAFLDVRKAFDEHGNLKPLHELDDDTAAAIAGMEVETARSGESVVTRTAKIKLSDKLGALNSLGKYLAMFSSDKPQGGVAVQVNVNQAAAVTLDELLAPHRPLGGE